MIGQWALAEIMCDGLALRDLVNTDWTNYRV